MQDAPSFSVTGHLPRIKRGLATVVLLAASLATASEPGPGLFSLTGSIDQPNSDVQLLPSGDGNVLMVGAYYVQSYDTVAGTWGTPDAMATMHNMPAVARLADGRVLIAGTASTQLTRPSAEIYDPASRAFTVTGDMVIRRYGAQAFLLGTGEVLVLLGRRPGGTMLQVAEAEIYNPNTGQFRLSGALAMARASATATVLANGQILVIGGHGINGFIQNTAEIYNPTTGQFRTVGSMRDSRMQHAAILLRDGRVLVGGGWSLYLGSSFRAIAGAEVFNPVSETFQALSSMRDSRMDHRFTMLQDGRVMATGGQNDYALFSTAVEIFDPASGQFTQIEPRLTTGRRRSGNLALGDGRILLVSGDNDMSNGMATTAEIFQPDLIMRSGWDTP